MEDTSFFIALMIHLFGLILGLGSVVVTDLFGLLWICNHVRFPQVVRISAKTEKFIWAGWFILVGAGIPLIYIKGVIDNLMILKLFFVGIIAINGIFLHLIHKKLKEYLHVKGIPPVIMFRLILAITISQIGWWSAFVIGFLHRHVQTVINWPDSPYLVCFLILGVFLTIWAIGETICRDIK